MMKASLRKTRARRRGRRGFVLVTAIWVIIVLLALTLIFASQTRVEMSASANRVSANQATAVELGAEQYVIAAVDACDGDAITVLNTPAEQVAIGNTGSGSSNSTNGGYFWILQDYFSTDGSSDTTYAFGITDENSKLNLNVATDPELATLPGITPDIADSIVLWRGGTAGSTSGQGADASVYAALPRPYTMKAANFESVDELYLINGMTDTLLYGSDLDHNGMLDANEQQSAGLASAFNSASDTSRGIFPFVTVWGKEPNTDENGKARTNIATITDTSALRKLLAAQKFSSSRVTQIVEIAQRIRTFKNVFDFAAKVGLKPAELASLEDSLTTSSAKTLPGLINVNTAPQQVLMAFSPALTQEDAQNIVAQRMSNSGGTASGETASGGSSSANTNTSAAWILSAITPAKAALIGSQITGQSYFYSADIVAVATDGTPSPTEGVGGQVGFKRVKIVVDARSSPPVIVYRKDLTYLGWPLDPAILTAVKQHKQLPAPSGQGTGGANGLSQQL